MTNPNNAIGTNGAFDGRTSPNALNDLTAAFTSGIVSGWNCAPKSGMTVQLGGSASVRDVALAQDNAGDKLTINNRSGAPVEVTLAGAPATNNRIDAIVAYVDNPSTGDGATTDNPTTCGIIAVSGTVAANPSAPTEAQIRSAITTDGATGGVAYYVVLATIRVGTNVTTIGSGVITQGAAVQSLAAIADGSVTTPKIADGAVTSSKVDLMTFQRPATGVEATVGKWSDGSTIYAQRFVGTFTTSTSARVAIQLIPSGVKRILRCEGAWSTQSNTDLNHPLGLPFTSSSGGVVFDSFASVDVNASGMRFLVSSNQYNGSPGGYDIVVFYTK